MDEHSIEYAIYKLHLTNLPHTGWFLQPSPKSNETMDIS